MFEMPNKFSQVINSAKDSKAPTPPTLASALALICVDCFGGAFLDGGSFRPAFCDVKSEPAFWGRSSTLNCFLSPRISLFGSIVG
jgi:hypothetical protein